MSILRFVVNAVPRTNGARLFTRCQNIQNDRRVSEAVLRNHRYRAKNEPAGYVNPSFILGAEACVAGIVDEPDKVVEDINDIYVNDGRARTDAEKQFNLEFVKKYMYGPLATWPLYPAAFNPRVNLAANLPRRSLLRS